MELLGRFFSSSIKKMLRVSLPGLHNQQMIAMVSGGPGSYSMAAPPLLTPCLRNCVR